MFDIIDVLFILQLFDRVEVTKPQASRSTSAEIFVVGLKYKAPANIDPRLLNIKHLFQGATAPPKVICKPMSNTVGYLDNVYIFLSVKKLKKIIFFVNILDN